jgi:hypothetical protein
MPIVLGHGRGAILVAARILVTMPRYSRLAVLLLACMVGGLFRPLDDGGRQSTRPSLDAPAVLLVPTGAPKIRAKAQSDGTGAVGLAVALRAGVDLISVVHRVATQGPDPAPRTAARLRLPARAPPSF